jgi:hypothetical protein
MLINRSQKGVKRKLERNEGLKKLDGFGMKSVRSIMLRMCPYVHVQADAPRHLPCLEGFGLVSEQKTLYDKIGCVPPCTNWSKRYGQ